MSKQIQMQVNVLLALVITGIMETNPRHPGFREEALSVLQEHRETHPELYNRPTMNGNSVEFESIMRQVYRGYGEINPYHGKPVKVKVMTTKNKEKEEKAKAQIKGLIAKYKGKKPKPYSKTIKGDKKEYESFKEWLKTVPKAKKAEKKVTKKKVTEKKEPKIASVVYPRESSIRARAKRRIQKSIEAARQKQMRV